MEPGLLATAKEFISGYCPPRERGRRGGGRGRGHSDLRLHPTSQIVAGRSRSVLHRRCAPVASSHAAGVQRQNGLRSRGDVRPRLLPVRGPARIRRRCGGERDVAGSDRRRERPRVPGEVLDGADERTPPATGVHEEGPFEFRFLTPGRHRYQRDSRIRVQADPRRTNPRTWCSPSGERRRRSPTG